MAEKEDQSPPEEPKDSMDVEKAEAQLKASGTGSTTTTTRRCVVAVLIVVALIVAGAIVAGTSNKWKDDDDKHDENNNDIGNLGDGSDDGDGSNDNDGDNGNPGTSNKWKDDDDKHDEKDNDNIGDGSELVASTLGDGKTYKSSKGPFNVSLNLFGKIVVTTPDSLEEREAVFDSGVANATRFLLNNMINSYSRQDNNSLVVDDVSEEIGDFPSADASADTSVSENLNDYGTNNQEQGVEEGDRIVSDGNFVYASYGNFLVVWEALTGQMVTSIEMPPFEPAESNETKAPTSDLGFDEDIAFSDFYYGDPYIQSLLLYQNRLVVVVGGYASIYTTSTQREYTILSSYLDTQIRLYDTATLLDDTLAEPTLGFIGERNVNGYFSAIRAVGQHAHVVTTSGIDTWTDLQGPLSPYNHPEMDEEEYNAYVQEAAEKAIPTFLDDLKRELSVVTGQLPTFTQMSLWQTGSPNEDTEDMIYSDGLLNSVTHVVSFDLLAGGVGDEEPLDVSITGHFLPSYWAQVYATTDTLIIAGEGWDYDEETFESTQSTYLVGMALQGASTVPHSVGKLDGAVLNSYSIDVVGNTLRMATTIQNSWMIGPGIVEIADRRRRLEEEESTTENYVTLLEIPSIQDGDEPAQMIELGKLKLGKPNEVFTAVRFFDNIAYAVTFERTDPFYVLNLDDPRNPTVTAELEITGFSRYLHSMNADNSLILALGEEADETGQVLGMKITVFDMSVPESPVVAQNYVIEQDPDAYSYSDAMWDFKAMRYVANQLIIPLNIWSEDVTKNFNGFETYFCSKDLIERKCRIHHENEYDGQCFHCGSMLAQRSMIFNGDVMTTNSHFVRSTNMNTCEQEWTLDIAVGDDCCTW